MKCLPYLSLAALLAIAPHATTARVLAADATTAAATTAMSNLQARLDAEPDLKGSTITVVMSGTTVTLKGTMTSPVARVKAVEIAKATEGVTKVVNKISLAKP